MEHLINILTVFWGWFGIYTYELDSLFLIF